MSARLECGIDEPRPLQPGEGYGVVGEMLRLAPGRRCRHDAEPREIVQDALLEFGSTAGRVDVLHAQQKVPPVRAAASALTKAEKAWPR